MSSKGDGDKNFILCNRDVCQVWWLNPEVCHVYGAGCRTGDRLVRNLPLHVKDLFVSFPVHRHVADELKMNGLSITVARR